MKKLAAKLWAVLMLMLVSMQTMATETFTNDRTDFRDESIYFMITTRFYDGDPKNNVLCWDNQAAQIETKDPCWRGDFQGVIDKLDYIKALGFTAIWITPVVQNASGYDYHGYHAMDFQHVDCRYQSSDGKSGDVMFQELIDKAHKRVSRSFLTSCSTTPVTSVRRSSASCSIVIHNFATKLTSMLV